ncbi:hypothetical protein OG558_12755 [Kribbella sp. NBC_01510]|uniref:hypothetical protein n=1 Tax=Kribbella sp. NBC_01510 TaxID=2903581 RepID=UPI003868B7E0
MGTSVYLGLITADPGIEAKIQEKHHITLAEVREALQWPAQAQTVEEDDPEHGHRWVAVGQSAGDRLVIAWLLPLPPYMGSLADTWTLKSARWL